MPIGQINTGWSNYYLNISGETGNFDYPYVYAGGTFWENNRYYSTYIAALQFSGLDEYRTEALEVNSAKLKINVTQVSSYTGLSLGGTTQTLNLGSLRPGNMPSMAANWLRNISTGDSGGYVELDITTLFSRLLSQEYKNNQIYLYSSVYNGSSGYIRFDGFSTANPPIIEVEYTLKPAKNPKSLAPNNTTIQREKEITVQWEYENAYDGDSQKAYQIQWSQDGGNVWTTINGTTAKSHTFPYETFNTGNVKWRVRVQNQNSLWSNWVNAEFNWTQILPVRPQSLSPDGVTLETLPMATWTYNSYNEGDDQTAFEIEYSNDGGQTTQTVYVTSSAKQWQFSGTLRGGLVRWRVRARSSYFQLMTPWSEYALWTYSIAPTAPTITSLAAFSTPIPTFAWTAPDQAAYELEVYQGETRVFTTGERNTGHKTYRLETFLENDTTYKVRIRVKNTVPLWSTWTEQTFTVAFVPTDQPELTTTEDLERYGIKLKIYNPVTSVTNELWRRKSGEITWERIAGDIPVNGMYVDCYVQSGVHYDYRARAVNLDESGYSDSDPLTRKVTMEASQLISSTDPVYYVPLIWQPAKSQTVSQQQAAVQYQGRKHPVIVWGDQETKERSVRFLLKTEDLARFSTLMDRRETMLFRDSRGRYEWVAILGQVTIEDDTQWMERHLVSMRLLTVDHQGAV